jgi:putative acetyltransferase
VFVSETARGRGVGDAIMRALEDHAKTEFVRHLKLETGNVLNAAQRMYARHGFTICDPFGDYTDAASSVFMEKTL